MPTYTKETALYDTGAIKNGIDGAAGTASKYITTVGNTGIKVHPYNETSGQADANNYSKIDSTGMDVVSDGTSRAKFGASTRIGKETGESRVLIDYHSLQLVDKEGNEYFHVSDLRGSDGRALITETFLGDNDDSIVFTVNMDVDSIDHVIFNGTPLPSSQYSATGRRITVTGVSFSSTSKLEIGYYTTQPEAKAFTIGTRDTSVTNPTVGPYSIVEGSENTASALLAHAEGHGTTASGDYSHAEGHGTTASGDYSHAEGYTTTASGDYSRAEGFHTTASGEHSRAEGFHTTAIGECSRAEGLYTTASGDYSHAIGLRTVADGDYQTAIGKYNTENSGALFSVGNGTSNSRSDAFSVYGNGTAEVKGHLLVGGSITAGSYPSGLYTEKVTIVDGLTVNHANYKTASKDIAKSGFTPIGIVGVHLENATSGGTYNTYVFTHSFYLSGNTAYFTLRNVHASTDAVIKLNAVILYAKS